MKALDLILATRANRSTGIERYCKNVARYWPVGESVAIYTSAENDEKYLFEVRCKGKAILAWLFLPFVAARQGITKIVFPGFPPSPLFLFFPRINLVRVIHDAVPFLFPKTLSVQGKLLFNWLERILLNRYCKIFAPTEIVASQIMEIFPNIICGCCGNAAGASLTGSARVPNRLGSVVKNFALAVGTVEPRKNYPELVSAWLKRDSDQILVIIGRAGWGGDASQIKSSLSHSNKIIWLDSATDEELRWCYANAALFITVSRAEGFNMPLVEAGISGLPILASDIPIHRFVAAPWARFVSTDQPDLSWTEAGETKVPPDEIEIYRARFSWKYVAETLADA